MTALTGRDFAARRAAWLGIASGHGNHHIYGKLGTVVRLSIPIHGNKPLKIGLMWHLAKLAEIPDDELR